MAIDLRLERQWSRELEDGLPDTRIRSRERDRVRRGGLWWDRVYCGNCGKLYGLVTSDWSPHVFAICNECADALGPPPGAVQIAEGK